MTVQHTIRRISANVREVVGAGMTILVSYETPVAVKYHDGCVSGVGRSRTRFSRSTESHIKKFLGPVGDVALLFQEDIDGVMQHVTGNIRLPEERPAGSYSFQDRIDTRNVNYEAHTEPGDKNLVVQVRRRRY